MQIIKVGTRASLLARTQTQQTIDRLSELAESQGIHVRFETVLIQTTGDRVLDVSLSKVGGKGLFTKEIEAALLDHTIDVAVHSLKDVPFEMDPQLQIAAIPLREDPRDAWLSDHYTDWNALPEEAVVGTSSLRRAAAVKHARPDVTVNALRGNVDTRYQKMKQGEFDGILLAAAGLHRLGWKERIRAYVPIEQCVPAVGQGALALQIRASDDRVLPIVRLIHDVATEQAMIAERAFMAELEGSCQVPLGAHAIVTNKEITIIGSLSLPDGTAVARETAKMAVHAYTNAESFSLAIAEMGREVARRLKQTEGGRLWRLIREGVGQ